MEELPTISVQQLEEALKSGASLTLLDVREDNEVAQSSLPDSIHIPLGVLPLRISELNITEPVAVICRSGGRSARATAFLIANGFIASNVQGGMLAYREQIAPALPPVL